MASLGQSLPLGDLIFQQIRYAESKGELLPPPPQISKARGKETMRVLTCVGILPGLALDSSSCLSEWFAFFRLMMFKFLLFFSLWLEHQLSLGIAPRTLWFGHLPGTIHCST